MQFNEFVEFIEKRYKDKVVNLERERDDLDKRYDNLLASHQKLKPPIFSEKHPFSYLLVGLVSSLLLVALTLVLIKIFPLVPKGLFIIPTSLITSFGIYAGYEITKMSKGEKGQESVRYTEYQKRHGDNEKELDRLLERRRELGNEIGNTRRSLENIDINSCKECYTYLIPSGLKGKAISINENVLDRLLQTIPLDAIIYKYYHDELDNFSKLSEYMQIQELAKLNLGYKIEQIKKEALEEVERQKVVARTKSDSLIQSEDLTRQTTTNTTSYQRQRRTERNASYYHKLENETNENEKISHHR